MKILYSNGSSTTYGLDLIKPKEIALSSTEYKKKYTYTGILGNSLSIPETINAAEPGSPNSSIVRRTFYDVTELLNKYKNHEILVCISFSPATPVEFFLRKYKRYFNLIFPEKLLFKIKDDPEYKIHEIKKMYEFYNESVICLDYLVEKFVFDVVSLQNFLENKKIKHFFFHTAPIISSHIDINTHIIDFQKIPDISFNKKVISQLLNECKFTGLLNPSPWLDFNTSSIIEYCFIKHKVITGKTGHIIEDGHQLWAQFLKEKILNDDKNIRSSK